jgi:hypothetical protein
MGMHPIGKRCLTIADPMNAAHKVTLTRHPLELHFHCRIRHISCSGGYVKRQLAQEQRLAHAFAGGRRMTSTNIVSSLPAVAGHDFARRTAALPTLHGAPMRLAAIEFAVFNPKTPKAALFHAGDFER